MEIYEQETKLYKALMHPARLAILDLLRGGEECVCHMEAAFGWRQAYISQQLMVLREAGLVEVRREGLNIFYRVIRPRNLRGDRRHAERNRDSARIAHTGQCLRLPELRG